MVALWEIVLVSIIVLLVLFFGLFVYFKDRKKKANLYFLLFSFSIGAYISTAFASEFFPVTNPPLAMLLTKITYVAVLWWMVFLFFFSLFFPEEKKVNFKLFWLIIFIGILLSGPILFTSLFIENIEVKPWGFDVIYGRSYGIFLGFIFLLLIFAAVNFIKSYKKAKDFLKNQLQFFFLGLGIYFVASIFFNVILPVFVGTEKYYQFGNYSAIFFLGFTAYAVVARRLFDIKVILTQVLVMIMALVLFIQTVIVPSLGMKILNGAIFILFCVFGYFLVKSVIREVQLRQEIEDLSRAKSEFISMASHQLRTPLSAIKGYISMMIEGSYGEISEKAREKLSGVFQSNERLIKIVNELLNISKVELGKMELTRELVQIEGLIQSCYEEMKIEAEKKNLKLVWQKPKKPLPEIKVDPLKIRQALLNLIDNALKYTKQGEIKIEVKKTDSSLQILVKDTGEGLTKEEQKNIFESFTRGEAGIAYWIEGAGLGLYVAKKYLELHQGRIWAESEGKGKGSTFYIELPIK